MNIIISSIIIFMKRDRRITLLDDFDHYTTNEDENNNFSDLCSSIMNNDEKAYLILNNKHKIICVSKKWEQICGYTQEEIYHEGFNKLHGPETDKNIIIKFMNDIKKFKKSTMDIINYTKTNDKIKIKVDAIKHDFNFDNIFPINRPEYIAEIKII